MRPNRSPPRPRLRDGISSCSSVLTHRTGFKHQFTHPAVGRAQNSQFWRNMGSAQQRVRLSPPKAIPPHFSPPPAIPPPLGTRGVTAAAPAPPGADPGTDLRGTGMLGLMQMLFFVLDTQTLPLAHDIFKLSQHETQARPPRAGSTPFWGKRSAKTSYSELRLDFILPKGSKSWIYSGNWTFSHILVQIRDSFAGSWLGAEFTWVKSSGEAGKA